MTPRSPTHAAALEYVQRGWFVHPLVPGGKEPATANGHKDATNNPAQVDAWWNANPNYNVGIAVAPSGLVVLDVDTSQKKDGSWKKGRESLAKIDAELTPTPYAITGRGGMHIVYARPPDVPAQRVIGLFEKESGLDLIGEGYIVAAPSYLAESGQNYRWAQNVPIVPLPPILQNVAKAPRTIDKVQTIGTPIAEGGRNNAMFRLGCALRDTGISAESLARALDAENQQRFTPPLADEELALIVQSVLNRVQPRRDVAADAIVAEEVQQIFAPPSRSDWLANVALQPQPPVLFYATGFPELDRLLNGGFATRQLIGIIGPPSAGKSALVGHWLLELQKQRPVLHCSLELMRHELFVRYAAHRMQFPWVEGVKGRIDQKAMATAVSDIRIRLFGAEDAEDVDPLTAIFAEAVKIQQECGIAPIIAIDYIQLMARGVTAEVRQAVGALTRRCRKMAQQLDTVVIGVFTTQRTTYGNKKGEEAMRAAGDPTAYLSAAKESGDIEYDCATLMYLDVDKLAEGATKPARIAVTRVRVGEVGFVGVRAKLDTGTFWEDGGALKDFAAEDRALRVEADQLTRAREAVLLAVDKCQNQPWRNLQAYAASQPQVQRKYVDKARDQLLSDGAIVRVDRYDENHRLQKGDCYIRNPNASPSVAPAEEMSL